MTILFNTYNDPSYRWENWGTENLCSQNYGVADAQIQPRWTCPQHSADFLLHDATWNKGTKEHSKVLVLPLEIQREGSLRNIFKVNKNK